MKEHKENPFNRDNLCSFLAKGNLFNLEDFEEFVQHHHLRHFIRDLLSCHDFIDAIR